MKADFNQHIRDEDIQLEKHKKYPSVHEYPTTAHGKNKLVKYYLVCKAALGLTATKTISLFQRLLECYPKDNQLQEPYWKGKEDEKKRRPYKYYKTSKEQTAYESGRSVEKM